MTRTALGITLALAMSCGVLAFEPPTRITSGSLEARVGKSITVTEVGRSPEKCQVMQVWRLPDGNLAMLVKSLATSELMTVVESALPDASGAKFRVYRWGPQGVPPAGSPLPPASGQVLPSPTRPSDKPVIASSRPAGKTEPNGGSGGVPVIEQARFLPPASGTPSETMTEGNALQPGSVKETVVRPGPVIVGQPNIPVELLPEGASRPAQPAPVMQAKYQEEAKPQPAPAAPQPSAPTPAPSSAPAQQPGSCCVCQPSNIILVTEPGRPTQKCEIVGVSPHGLGGKALHVKNLETGECFTIIEGGLHRVGNVFSRFSLLRGKSTCPVICATCESCPPTKPQPAPASEPMPAPQPAKPAALPVIKPSEPAASSGSSRFASSLLPPEDSAPGTEKPAVKAESKSPAVTEVPVPNKDKPGVGDGFLTRIWNLASEKTKNTRSAPSPKATTMEKQAVQAEPKEEKPKVEGKREEATLAKEPAKPMAPQAKAAPTEQVPVPVPLVPLATTEPRPIAPPPQPPIKPFNTLASSSMSQMPQSPMAPSKPESEAMTAPQVGSGVPVCPSTAGVAAASVWSRGPVAPISQPPAVVTVSKGEATSEPLSMETTVQLMKVLHTSGVPSQREFAATRLRNCDALVQPYVVEALITAIRSDAAPLVRVAAIASLKAMNVKSKPVLTALQAACNDRDPRVRDEAEEALRMLTEGSSVERADYRNANPK